MLLSMVWQGQVLLNFYNNIPILPENDIVIILAGPAGLGLGAIEIAASVFKAKVIAVSDTEDSSSLIRDEGAEKAVCMSEGVPAVYKFLREAIGKNRAAVIYDAVGQGHLHTFQDLLVDQESLLWTTVINYFRSLSVSVRTRENWSPSIPSSKWTNSRKTYPKWRLRKSTN